MSNENFKASISGSIAGAYHIHKVIDNYNAKVIIHTDHCSRNILPWIDGLIDYGKIFYKKNGYPLFSSHMIDLSEESLEDNIGTCKEYLKKLTDLEMTLEIELGVTGGEEDGVDNTEIDSSKLYTQPEEVAYAYSELSSISENFMIAAAFGNVHGVYKPGNVKLRPEILKNSQDLVKKTCSTDDRPLDLVFHGGSGSDKEKIAEALIYGVFKMNIDTDTQFAYSKAIGRYVEENHKAFKHQIDPEDGTPYKKQYDPRKYLRIGEESMVERLDEAFQDLGSVGRTLAS